MPLYYCLFFKNHQGKIMFVLSMTVPEYSLCGTTQQCTQHTTSFTRFDSISFSRTLVRIVYSEVIKDYSFWFQIYRLDINHTNYSPTFTAKQNDQTTSNYYTKPSTCAKLLP